MRGHPGAGAHDEHAETRAAPGRRVADEHVEVFRDVVTAQRGAGIDEQGHLASTGHRAGGGERLPGPDLLVGGLQDGEGGPAPDRVVPGRDVDGAGGPHRDLRRRGVAGAEPAQEGRVLDGGGDRGSGEASAAPGEESQPGPGRLVAAGVEAHLVGTHAEAVGQHGAGTVEQTPAAAPGGVPRRGVGPRHVLGRDEGLQGLRQKWSGGRVEETVDPARGGRHRGVLLDRITVSRHASRLVPPFACGAPDLR